MKLVRLRGEMTIRWRYDAAPEKGETLVVSQRNRSEWPKRADEICWCRVSSDRHGHDLPYGLCVSMQRGSVFFVPPGATETAINAPGEVFREILIELKGAASGGATLAAANVPAPISRA